MKAEHANRLAVCAATLLASVPLLWPLTGRAAAAGSPLPPTPAREFRGAWVATVSNIDWPSKPGLPSATQKAELLAILDQAAKLKLNAILFQVRPACDALYPSQLEPWSEYLTGKMGQPPNAFYDPLAFAISEAHARGLELHAWFNPFRARHPSAQSPIASNHISRTHPQWVKNYGKSLWLDPAEPGVQDHALAVILDVVHRYDVDGVHLDDYFYPYQEKDAKGRFVDFPDESSWKRYVTAGGKLSRHDWRRENVNQFIQRLYRAIKTAKTSVKFGISPFGIWRPGHPSQIKGLDAYEQLYADSRKWLANGWVDYFAPQLYWPLDAPGQSYSVLLDWWLAQNTQRRHLWPGMNSAKVLPKGWPPKEIVSEIRHTRRSAASGHIHWNMKSLMPAGSLAGALEKELYAEPALVPASPWLDDQPPGKPAVSLDRESRSTRLRIAWQPTGPEAVWLWVVQTRTAGRWKTVILPGNTASQTFQARAASELPDAAAVTAVDRCGNISLTTLANVP